MEKLKKFFSNLRSNIKKNPVPLLIVLYVILFLILLEGASRLFIHIPEEAAIRTLQPYFMNGHYYGVNKDKNIQNLMQKVDGAEAYHYEKSSNNYLYNFGFPVLSISDRGNVFFQEKADIANNINDKDSLRVFIVGASVAAGEGADTENRYYNLLEQKLSAALNKKVSVIPAAMGGFNSTQERILLELMVIPRKPDVVLILDGYNEIQPFVYGSRPGDPYNMGFLYKEYFSDFYKLKTTLAKYSHFYKFILYNSIHNSINDYQQNLLNTPDLKNNAILSINSVYLTNVKSMLESCWSKNIPAIVFIQPCKAITLHNQGVKTDLSNIDVFTLEYYSILNKLVKENNISYPVFELTDIFNDRPAEEIYYDPVHFLKEGHEILADAMLEKTLKIIQQKPSDKNIILKKPEQK